MQLRPRQKEAVAKAVAALKEHKNTLLVAPTGAGKTVMMAATAEAMQRELGVRTGLVLQHRDELVSQNRRTFWLVDRTLPTDLYTADRKRWVRDGWTFAMVQTLERDKHLSAMPPVQAVMIDEAHHAAASSYRRILDRAIKLNPDALIFGVTATPNRGDKKALRGTFSNCADQITLRELIAAGFLVRPRTFVIDLGVQDELKNVRKLATDFDMAAVEAIMNREVLNERVVAEWRRLAGTRQTVVFCSTVQHANHVRAAFGEAGVAAATIHGEIPDGERRRILDSYDRGEIQVLVNVAVLTEGWDHQPTSCVVLLRPSSYKSTMVQMIGRGLRKVDPERYPGIVKDDCIIIDFGTSILTHGAIEDEVDLEGGGTKACPECLSIVPKQCSECPICGHAFPTVPAPTKACGACGHANGLSAKTCKACGEPFPAAEEDPREVIDKFVLTEVDLLEQSPFRWEELFDGLVMVAYGFDAWAACVLYQGRWHALGCAKESGGGVRLLLRSEDRILALASADDFMREHADTANAKKTKAWLHAPATPKQCQHLGIDPMAAFGLTRYRACCLLTWQWNEWGIRKKLMGAALPAAA